MTDEEINQRIAEACGWKEVEPWLNGDRCFEKSNDPCGYRIEDLPNYCTDLNAMHEAEKVLGEKRIRTYAFLLAQILDTSPTVDLDDQFLNIHATARQRAEAFLRALGKWEEVQG